MKITITETRECCQERDLKPYNGIISNGFPVNPGGVLRPVSFCRHCGQLHVAEVYTDAAGDQDTRWRKWPLPTAPTMSDAGGSLTRMRC